jgi:hypothetical protein
MKSMRLVIPLVLIGIVGCGGSADPGASSPDGALDAADTDTNVFQIPDAGDTRTAPKPDAEPSPDTPCVPNCTNKECGDDGCGESCGVCKEAEICTSVGTCDPDPSAGCGGLTLAEDWAGEYDGSYNATVFGLLPLSGDTKGNLSFSLKCFNSKLIVSGTMTGQASGQYPFELTFSGTFNPDTQVLKCSITTGKVTFASFGAEVEFEGDMPGSLQQDGTFSGTFNVTATAATLFGNPLDPTTFSAGADGTWTAAPAP